MDWNQLAMVWKLAYTFSKRHCQSVYILDDFRYSIIFLIYYFNYTSLELILIPLLLGILSYLIPKNILPWFALLGSALVLIHQITLLPNFDPQSTIVLWKAQEAMPLGLTFEMKWDGFSMLMLLMTSSISFLISYCRIATKAP